MKGRKRQKKTTTDRIREIRERKHNDSQRQLRLIGFTNRGRLVAISAIEHRKANTALVLRRRSHYLATRQVTSPSHRRVTFVFRLLNNTQGTSTCRAHRGWPRRAIPRSRRHHHHHDHHHQQQPPPRPRNNHGQNYRSQYRSFRVFMSTYAVIVQEERKRRSLLTSATGDAASLISRRGEGKGEEKRSLSLFLSLSLALTLALALSRSRGAS